MLINLNETAEVKGLLHSLKQMKEEEENNNNNNKMMAK